MERLFEWKALALRGKPIPGSRPRLFTKKRTSIRDEIA
jgi:hypothetical protein